MKKSLSSLAVLALTFALTISLTSCQAAPKAPPKKEKDSLSSREAAIFYAYVADRVKREYVEPVDADKLLEGALNGMLGSLDPHSSYLPPKKYQEVKSHADGKYGGLGMEIYVQDTGILVVSALDDTPAAEAGIQPGDLIVAVDNTPVFGFTPVQAQEALRGEPGSDITLIVRHKDNTTEEKKLKRAIIKVKPVKWRLEGDAGYIRISTFSKGVGQDVKKAMDDLRSKSGNKLKGFVIDVRNNAGGLLEEAYEVTDIFLDELDVVSIRGRDSTKDIYFTATKGDYAQGLPLVVLVNSGSASASEILAGAIQDHKRGLVVGTKTFGKGSVQTVVPMTNGGAIKLTTAIYYTPKGRSIQKEGIVPDVKVEQVMDAKSIEDQNMLREANLSKALENGKKKETAPASESGETPPSLKSEILKELPDYQLKQALAVLKVMSLYEKRGGKNGGAGARS